MKRNLLLKLGIFAFSFIFIFSKIKAQWIPIGNADSSKFFSSVETSCVDTFGNIYIGSYGASATGLSRWNVSPNNWSIFSAKSCVSECCVYISALHCDKFNNVYFSLSQPWNSSRSCVLMKVNTLTNKFDTIGNATLADLKFEQISAIVNDTSGNIYVAGYILAKYSSFIGNRCVAKWTKATNTWTELAGTNNTIVNSGLISSIAIDNEGNIYAAGSLVNSFGKNFVAKWSNANNSWSELGGINSLSANSEIKSIVSDKQGNIYAAGWFRNIVSGNCYVAKWSKNSNTWTELGGLNVLSNNNEVKKLEKMVIDEIGNIYVTGQSNNSMSNYFIAKWTKASDSWSELGGVNSLAANKKINSINFDKFGNVYAGGDFTNLKGATYLAKLDVNTNIWSEVGAKKWLAVNSTVESICSDANNNIYAAGSFRNDSAKCYVGKWNFATNTLSELGGFNSMKIDIGEIRNICCDRQGNVFATGSFYNKHGEPYVIKWDKTTNIWQELGNPPALGYSYHITSIMSDSIGNIYTGRNNGVFKWEKATNTWGELGGPNALNGFVGQTCLDPFGNIYAVGSLRNNSYNYYVAKWNKVNNTWSELGGANSISIPLNINAVCSDPFGNIYIINYNNTTSKHYVAKWDRISNSWNVLGNLPSSSISLFSSFILKSDSQGNIYALGGTSTSICKNYIVKWTRNTNMWSLVGGDNNYFTEEGDSGGLLIDETSNRFFVGGYVTQSVYGRNYWSYYQNTNLPIKLTNFSAKKINEFVKLNWETKSVVGIKEFEVEKSLDGNNFLKIGFLKSNINNYKYEFNDVNILNSNSFYRLKMIVIDGSFEYSEIKKVSFFSSNSIDIFPNPAKDKFTINSKVAIKGIKLVNTFGQIVATFKNINTGITQLTVNDLKKGIYIMQIFFPNDLMEIKKIFIE